MSDNRQLLGGPPALNPPPSRNPSFHTRSPPLGANGDVQHVAFLSQNIGALYLNDDYTDVTLHVEETEFPAHKVILAARSEYFRALLYGGMRETAQKEITIQDASVASFRLLLRYVYTGTITLTNLKEELVLDILGLAHKFGFSELETAVSEYLKAILNTRNLCTIFGASHLYSLASLEAFCLDYADKHAGDVLQTDGFSHLNASAVEQLLSRDSFSTMEIEIFKAVREWVRVNGDTDAEAIVAQIRLPLMKLDDLLNTVRPSCLMNPDLILDAIKEQTEKRDMDLRYRGFLLPDVNVATPGEGAQVIEGELKQALLNGDSQNYDMERGFTRHPIEPGNEGIVIQLGTQSILNHIRLLLWDRDQRSYSYYVEVSMDKKDWIRVVDYSNFLCRAWQRLYFPPKVVQYIRVMGTHNTVNRVFHLVALEAYYTSTPFNVDGDMGILIPTENVATIEGSASVIEGVSRSRNALLNGDTEHYDWDSGYTCHQLGSGAIVIQLPQPYLIDSMRLLLWDCDDRTYSYYIEVSTDQSDQNKWRLVADKTKEACKAWQLLQFERQPMTFIRIVGTHNSANEVFHCVHFECPAQPILRSSTSSVASSTNSIPATLPSRLSAAQLPQACGSGAGNGAGQGNLQGAPNNPNNNSQQIFQQGASGGSNNQVPFQGQNFGGPQNMGCYQASGSGSRSQQQVQQSSFHVTGEGPGPVGALSNHNSGAAGGSQATGESSGGSPGADGDAGNAAEAAASVPWPQNSLLKEEAGGSQQSSHSSMADVEMSFEMAQNEDS